jgi:rod shape-determining protein MreC
MNQARTVRNRSILILLLLIFISFILMGISQSKFTIRFKSVAYGVLYPFQFIGVKSITLAKDFFSSIENNRELKEELRQVRILLEQYERSQYEYEEIKRENERLRSMIGVQASMEYETVIAEIVAKSPQNFYRTIIVNRGRSSGINRNMPVVAYQNESKCVVGKVIDVQQFSSRIQPLVDQSSYIGAMLMDSRYSGILQGQSPISDNCHLQFVDRRAEIKFGDLVVTSGMGGVFPKGIVIGKIVSVSKKRYGVFQEALVEPLIDFGRLEEVYIITKSVTQDYDRLLGVE